MNRKEQDKIVSYSLGELSEEEAKLFEEELSNNEELKAKLAKFQNILKLEKEFKQKSFELSENFTVKVIDRIKQEEKPIKAYSDINIWSKVMSKIYNKKVPLFVGSLATACLAVVFVYRSQHSVWFNDVNLLTDHIDAELSTPSVSLKSTDQTTSVLNEKLAKKKKPKINSNDKASQIGQREIDDYVKNRKDDTTSERGSIISHSNTLSSPKTNNRKQGIIRLRRPSGATGEFLLDSRGHLVEADKVVKNSKQETKPRQFENYSSKIFSPPQKSREKYGEYKESRITEVKENPVSTFSIDVDTGSYTNTRRFLRLGQLPPANSVRIEEFINYFDYNYPEQFEKPFSLNYEIQKSPLQKDKYLLKLGLKAKDSRSSEKPWNLVFLIDVSGSMMSQDKLGLVKQSLKLLTKNMRSGDKISIVTYAGSSRTILNGVNKEKQAQILSSIDSLRSGGGTNGSGGIINAYQIAERNFIKDGVNRVILATDGDFNVGISNTNALIKLIEEKRKSNITLTTVGVGTGNYNEAMMEQIADHGNGSYHYLDSFKEARKVFSTDLFGNMEVVAKDVKLQIEFNPNIVSHYRLVGYDNRMLKREDFTNDKIDAGEIGSSHTVTAIYEVIMKGSDLANSLSHKYRYSENDKSLKHVETRSSGKELAFLKIRHKEPNGSKSKETSFPIVGANAGSPSTDFNFSASVAYFGAKLRQSEYADGFSYDDIISLAEKNKGEDKNGYRREFIELVKSAKNIAK